MDQLLKMLDSDQLEVVVGNEMLIDYIIKEMQMPGRLRKAAFLELVKYQIIRWTAQIL
mgnify:CR=1 FL=1